MRRAAAEEHTAVGRDCENTAEVLSPTLCMTTRILAIDCASLTPSSRRKRHPLSSVLCMRCSKNSFSCIWGDVGKSGRKAFISLVSALEMRITDTEVSDKTEGLHRFQNDRLIESHALGFDSLREW